MLPGLYTIKLTKGDQVYTSKLNVVMDPRAKYSMEDRKAQYDQAIKLYKSMAKMSFAVDSMVGLRDGADARRETAGRTIHCARAWSMCHNRRMRCDQRL